MKLFCFPFAGGSAAIYNRWINHSEVRIAVRPIELAGRGRRINEKAYINFKELLDDATNQIEQEIDKTDYALFGHSMGGRIALELACQLEQSDKRHPKHVFLSGVAAPSVFNTETLSLELTDNELEQRILKLGGTPKEVLENSDLRSLFFPIIRNDFRLLSTLPATSKIRALNSPLTVFLGKDEEVTPQATTEWRRWTQGTCSIHYLNGGHFFITDHMSQMLNLIFCTLLNR